MDGNDGMPISAAMEHSRPKQTIDFLTPILLGWLLEMNPYLLLFKFVRIFRFDWIFAQKAESLGHIKE
jgi:hypothetical protein